MRLGYIDYLNLLPVYYGLETGRTRFQGELVTGPPTYINDLYRQGRVDVAPVSSIEYARGAGSVLLPGLSVASWGHVQSILLLSKRAPEDLDGANIAYTSSSATSVVLAKVLLRRHWRVQCGGRMEPPDLDQMLAKADAALLIGDDALKAGLRLGVLPWRSSAVSQRAQWRGEPLVVSDLGAAWWDYKALPMVFAVFAARGAEVAAVAMEVLGRSQAEASVDVAGLLRRASEVRGFPPDLAVSYLLGSIRHDLGSLERQGLLAFYQEAAAIGEIDAIPELRLAEDLDRSAAVIRK